jgi:hypothetical protein
MVKRIHWLLLLSFFTSSCGGITYRDFQDKIEESAKDKIVDQAEYEAVLSMAENSDDAVFGKLRVNGGDIDRAKLREEIFTYAQKKKLGLERANIWDPNAAPSLSSFNINVFMENSGSMNGYLNDPSTEFKNTVYSLLTRLKLLAGQDSLNLYFVNKKEQPQFVNATNEDLESFKNKLNPSSFQATSGGNTAESDLYAFMKKCLEKSNTNNLSVLISDCIYSPGPKYPDATTKLGEMRQGLFLQFSDTMRVKDLSALVLQFYGNFQGTYYNQLNKPLKIATPVRRPYYVWFIGTSAQIETLLKSKRLMELDGNIENNALFQKLRTPNIPDYKIISKALHGSFGSDEISKKVIIDAEASREEKDKRKFGFQLAVDFSGGLQDLDYYDDPNNYKCSDGSYKIVVERNKESSKKSLQNKTHILKLTTDKLTEGILTIDVIARLPAWVEASNSVNDIDFLNDPSQELKTFGLSALMNGFGDAFYRKSQTNSIQTLTVTIKK